MKFKIIVLLVLCFSLLLTVVSCSSDNDNSSSAVISDSVSGGLDDTTSAEESTNDANLDSSFDSNFSSEEISNGVSSNDISEDSSSGDSSQDVSQNPVDDPIEDGSRFSVISPQVEFNKVWENGKMELFNTDFRMSEELEKKFVSRFGSFSKAQSVALIDLETNMAFSYSKDTKIATASAIKGPMALFFYKCIDDGIITWETKKAYQPRHFQANSTGKVQNSPYGTAFTMKTLIDYMIRISDNQAYLMIKEHLGVENFEKMMASLGSTRIIPQGSNWGYITGWEMAATWREIYYYSLFGDNGAELFDRFMHAQYNYIWRAIKYETAHKSGWSGKAYNDAGIVDVNGRKYVIVLLMGRNGMEDASSQYQFNNIAKLLAELMLEYNDYVNPPANDTSDVE